MAIIHGISDSELELLSRLPNEVESISDINRVKREFEEKMTKTKGFWGGLKRWNYQRQINKFDGREFKVWLAGAIGEKRVIDRLSHLDNSYHVFGGIKLQPRYGDWAQVDCSVVGPTGIYMIEIKNWSDQYARNPIDDPHEQAQRAGLALYKSINQLFWRGNIRVTNVILPIKNNIIYRKSYPHVLIVNINNINTFITNNKRNYLDTSKIKKIVRHLSSHTNSY